MTTTTTTPAAFGEWVIIEQLGHRRLAGWLTEQTIAGHGYLRLDVPAVDGQAATSHLLAHSSIYAIHPTSEAVATAVAAQCRPQPVQRWELPAVEPEIDHADGYDGPDPDPDYGKDLDDEDDHDGRPF